MRFFALAALLAISGTAFAAAEATPSYSIPGCQMGRHGQHLTGVDLDRDGVPDSEDWCSGTPEGSRVGPDGCALGQVDVACFPGGGETEMRVVPTAMREAPAAATVSTDSDGDGVADAADRCPGTPRGAEVDANGCVTIEKVVLKGVNFATGSANLLPAASETLRTVADAMKANTRIEVEIAGYTDSVGNDDRNQALSERRAESVRQFLVQEGVDADRLSTRGYGESNPADTNDTAAGRANNRRVAFRVTAS